MPDSNEETVRRAAQALGLPMPPDWGALSYQGYGVGAPLTQAALDRAVAIYLKRWGGQLPHGLLVLIHQGNGHSDELRLTIAGCQAALVDAADFKCPRLRPGDVLIYPPVPVGAGGPAKERN